ncbi:hypothetical protein [Gimesia sp.]|uniref:hypothetical protein n=1 Tax=Gimesia sp. TaxID=2024833 RepID=UPI003A913A2C
MNRRKKQNKFSLFAFQDIITSVTGIVIFITLLMSLELIQRHPMSAQADSAELIKQLKQQLVQAQQASQMLQQQIDTQNQELTPDAFLDANSLKQKLADAETVQQEATEDAQSMRDQKSKAEQRLNTASQTAAQRKQDAEEIKKLKKEIAHKSEQVKKMEDGKRLVFRPAQNTPKTQWLVDVSEQNVQVARMGVISKPLKFSNYQQFQSWVSGLSSSADYCMLLLRPDAAKSYEEVFKMLDQRGISFGYDAIDQDKVVIDPQDGAGV